MKTGPTIHRRRSMRLQGYDYSQPGMYFVTICTQNRECRFGHIADGEMRLNDAGKMIQTVWNEIPIFYPGIKTDEFVIMPNHIHGIVVITAVGATPCGCPDSPCGCPDSPCGCPDSPCGCPDSPCGCPGPTTQKNDGLIPKLGQAQGPAPTRHNIGGKLSLPDVVHRFKTMTTKRYTDGVKQSDWPRFSGKLWQRNYWEHIIRNDSELNRIRDYIQNNPKQWELDQLFVVPIPVLAKER